MPDQPHRDEPRPPAREAAPDPLRPALTPDGDAHAGAATPGPGPGPAGPPRIPDLPPRIGPYRTLSVLGEGGMGTVIKAEHRHPVRRLVALKLVKLGLDTKAVLARFDAERQALAMMDHPGIARVLDAGSTESGRPYFVMELVRGEAITSYCDRNRLSIPDRLQLFAEICDAVQHAHQKGVIHRDIKPSNVLVAEQDGRPVPKIIDFGVAKALFGQLTLQTCFTELHRPLGTPGYMSPEQAEGVADIDTRTDIYSLGVLLYELLTGQLPFQERDTTRGGRPSTGEPPAPSTVLLADAEASRRSAQLRRTTVERLTWQLRRELEWIPLKAMRETRNERYATAAALAEDVRRYLAGEPLVAAPDRPLYRLRKLANRHRRALAAAAAVLVLLLAHATTTTWQAVRATAAERRADAARIVAEERTERHRATAALMYDVLSGLDPTIAAGRDTTLLLEIARRTEERLDNLPHPVARAGYLHLLGDLYRKLGDRDRAGPLLERGVALSRVGLADAVDAGSVAEADYEAARVLAQGCLRYAAYLRQGGEWERAVLLAREAYEVVSTHLPEDHPERAFAEADLAAALFNGGLFEEAAGLASAAAARMEARPEVFTDAQRGLCLGTLAALHASTGDWEAAEAAYSDAAALLRRGGGGQSLAFAEMLLNWAVVAAQLGDHEAALDRLDSTAGIRDALLGSERHPDRLREWDTRSIVLARLERHGEAAETLGRAIAIAETLPPERDWLARSAARMARYLRRAGDADAAEAWEERSRSFSAGLPAPDDQNSSPGDPAVPS